MSFIQEVLERTIYHRVLDTLVDMGYAADSRDEVAYPDDVAGRQAFKAAQEQIKADKGFFIKMFSFGNNQSKGAKDVPRIVLAGESFIPGNIGRDTVTSYTPGTPNWYNTERFSAQRTTDFEFTVYLVANRQEQIRILNEAFFRALTPRGYIPVYGSETDNFFCQFLNDWNTPDLDRGLIEKALRFEITDFYLTDPAVTNDAIPAISNIDIEGAVEGNEITESNLQFPEGLVDDSLIYDNDKIYG